MQWTAGPSRPICSCHQSSTRQHLLIRSALNPVCLWSRTRKEVVGLRQQRRHGRRFATTCASADLAAHAQTATDISMALRQLADSSAHVQHLADLLPPWPQQHLADTDSLAVAASSAANHAQHLLRSHAAGMYDVADAAAASPPAQAAATAGKTVQRTQDWLTPIADGLDYILQGIKGGLDKAHVPESYGWSIVGLTIFTKVLTFPFTKAQVESAMSVQNLKPTIDEIKRLYGEDNKKKIQRETSALYEKAGINPLAGCLPTLATIPIFWGLFRTLSNVTNEGQLTEGFYWIPSLAGPASLADRSSGTGTAWLFPFVDGVPPLGWDLTTRYLAIPVLLVILQWLSSAVISPPPDPNQDESSKRTAVALNTFLPLMVGWFSISLPSGLGLYYLANIVITSGQQIYLRKLGGAKGLSWQQEIGINQARRTGIPADLTSPFVASCWKTIAELSAEEKAESSGQAAIPAAPVESLAQAEVQADAVQSPEPIGQEAVPEAPLASLAEAEAVQIPDSGAEATPAPPAGPTRSKRKRAQPQEPAEAQADTQSEGSEFPQAAAL